MKTTNADDICEHTPKVNKKLSDRLENKSTDPFIMVAPAEESLC